jgi:hypothetical protein
VSTRSTLAHGENFHLYQDLMEEDEGVWLSLNNTDFHASSGEVCVKIPLALWEHIRQVKAFQPEYYEMSDQDISDYVTFQVDDRIREWNESDKNGLMSLFGAAVYGLASDPREQQIATGIENLTKERARELEILAKVAAYKGK